MMGTRLRWTIQPAIKLEDLHTDFHRLRKWVEIVALLRAMEESVINFNFELFVQYGLPREVITNGGAQFVGNKITTTLKNHHIIHKVTSPYHLQENGQVESTNKFLEEILTKKISTHRRDWATRLPRPFGEQHGETPLDILRTIWYLEESLFSLSNSK